MNRNIRDIAAYMVKRGKSVADLSETALRKIESKLSLHELSQKFDMFQEQYREIQRWLKSNRSYGTDASWVTAMVEALIHAAFEGKEVALPGRTPEDWGLNAPRDGEERDYMETELIPELLSSLQHLSTYILLLSPEERDLFKPLWRNPEIAHEQLMHKILYG